MDKDVLQVGVVTTGGTTGQTDFRSGINGLIGISGCLVLIADSGCAIVYVGFKRRVLRKGMIAVLFYDDTFWFQQISNNFKCRFVALSYDNVQEAIYKLSSPYFWDYISESPLFQLDSKQWMFLERWYEQMQWICRDVVAEYVDNMIRNNIYNLFMAMDSEMVKGLKIEKKTITRSRYLIIEFLKLISQHCHHQRDVSFYAEQLCITTTYLYKLTRKRLNLSPKELIDEQTICEIKTLLVNTEKTIKEIADTFHFDDKTYMCRYFRRHTGLSPNDYRNGIKKH